jgi:hypothetical protein
MVALAGPVQAPQVILRRHLVIASGPKQPYHAAVSMPVPDAGVFIQRCAASTLVMATNAVQEAVAELARTGFEIAGACVLEGSGRSPGDLARILSSHPLLHTAEGEFYRSALKQACVSCGLVCIGLKEKGLLDSQSEHRALEWGKPLGPPWRQDHKLAALAAWHILAREFSPGNGLRDDSDVY